MKAKVCLQLLLLLWISFSIRPAVAFAATRSAIFSGQRGEVTPPNSSQFQNMGSNTIEFRVHGIAPNATDQILFYTDDTSCVLRTNLTTIRCRTWIGTSNYVDLAIGTATDIRIRVQYDLTGSRFIAECWNGDGSNYQAGQFPITPQARVYDATRMLSLGGLSWGAPFFGRMSFFRWSTGIVGINASVPADVAPANLFRYDFENNTNDSSPTGRNLTIVGAALSYQDTPSYAPQVNLSTSTVSRAAFSAIIDGQKSFSSYGDGSIVRYQWQQVGGAFPAEIKDTNNAVATVVMPVAGSYIFRLQVTDAAGAVGARDIKVGAVATDDANIVMVDSPNIAFVLGPLTRSGTSPWPWYDQKEIQVANLLGQTMPPSPGDQPLPGSISVSPGSATITGSGTNFFSLFNCNAAPNDRDYIMIHYPLPGGGTGRQPYTVVACNSDQQITISPAYEMTQKAATAVNYAKVTVGQVAAWTNGSNNWNYYDAVLAYYRLFYRTGQTQYRGYARALADRWWKYPIDEGRACNPDSGTFCQAPRLQALLGLMVRASDGRPEMWPGIRQHVDLLYQLWIGKELGKVDDTVYDIREAGYMFQFMVIMARLHPDPTVRQQSLDKAMDGFRRYWKMRQWADGSWRMDIGAVNPSLSYTGKGTLPWQMAFVLKGLVSLHQITGDADVLDSIKKAVEFISGVGYNASCRGLWYTVQYTSCPQDYPCKPCTFANGGSGTCAGNTCNYTPRPDMEDRTYSNATHEIYGYLYAKTGDESYRTMGDNLFSANLGGNGGGPGADGGNGSFADAITYGPEFAKGKEFGFVSGAGGAQKYLAYRRGNPQLLVEQTMQISFDMAQVANATKVKMNVTRPDSTTFAQTCSSSPCAIVTDGRQGNHIIVMEYQNAANSTLSVSEPISVVVR